MEYVTPQEEEPITQTWLKYMEEHSRLMREIDAAREAGAPEEKISALHAEFQNNLNITTWNTASFNYMWNTGTEELKEAEPEFWDFPYSRYTRYLGNELSESHYQIPTRSLLTEEQLNLLGLEPSTYRAYLKAGQRIEADAQLLSEALLGGGASFLEDYAAAKKERQEEGYYFLIGLDHAKNLVEKMEKEGVDNDPSYIRAANRVFSIEDKEKGEGEEIFLLLNYSSDLYNLMHALCLIGYEKELREILRPALPIKVRGNRALNDLGRTDSKKQGYRDFQLQQTLLSSKRERMYQITTGQTQLIFKEEIKDLIKIDASTDRTLTALLGCIPESSYGKNEVVRAETTLDNLMKLYGQKDRKSARASIRRDLDTLAGLTIRTDDKGGLEDYIGVPLAGDIYGISKNGVVGFSFSPSFMLLLGFKANGAFTSYLPQELFKVNMKYNPHAWTIGKKLINHSGANLGDANENILSVKSLLEWVESIPGEEEIAEGARQYTKRIIEPMERDLSALVDLGVLDFWDYCHEKGAPLAAEEQAARLDADGNEKPMPYEIAKGLYITWKLAHEFDREARLERKEQRRLEAAEAKAIKEKKEKQRKERRERAEDKRLGELNAEGKEAPKA